eukprot:scaffold23138_cov41-Cyclotella_meneghiniana.AAC.8
MHKQYLRELKIEAEGLQPITLPQSNYPLLADCRTQRSWSEAWHDRDERAVILWRRPRRPIDRPVRAAKPPCQGDPG